MGYISGPDDMFIRGASATGYIFGLPLVRRNAPNLPIPGSGTSFTSNDINGNATHSVIGTPIVQEAKVYGDGWPQTLIPGLLRQKFAGYYDDDVNYVVNNNALAGSNVVDTIVGFGLQELAIDEAYTLQWTGYFKAPATGTYNFYTISDDSSLFWMGFDAKAYAYSRANALVDNGGAHGSEPMAPKHSVSLTAGEYYPIRMQFGEAGGGESCQLWWSNSAGQSLVTNDFTGLVFYDPVDPKFGE